MVSNRVAGAMKALIAVQRKLLELAYTLFKTKTSYDKSYESKKQDKKNSTSAQKA
jgi:transposase